MTFFGCAVDEEYPSDKFGVGVSTTGEEGSFTMLQNWTMTAGGWHSYSVDLSNYVGQTIYVAIRHYTDIDNAYFVQVDNIRISGIEATVTAKAVGAVVYCNGQPIKILNHGEQSFIHNVNRYESNYCIRIIQAGPRTGRYYALAEPQCVGSELECVAPTNLTGVVEGDNAVISWERNYFTDFSEDPQGWSILDGDGDGYSFSIYNIGGMSSPGSQPDQGTAQHHRQRHETHHSDKRHWTGCLRDQLTRRQHRHRHEPLWRRYVSAQHHHQRRRDSAPC